MVACHLPATLGLTCGRMNQDELNEEDKFHFVQCSCDKIKAGFVRPYILNIENSTDLLVKGKQALC